MRKRNGRSTQLRARTAVAVVVSGGTLLAGCAGDEATPTEKACDRLVDIGERTMREGELPLHEYREGFAAAWTDAARDPASPIADPLDRSIGIVDRSPNGYLLPADRQHLMTQLDSIRRICTGG